MCVICYNKHLRLTNESYRIRSKAAAIAYRKTAIGHRKFTSSILKKRYGITIEQREQMFKDQNGLCKICEKPKKLVVEHCHRTKRVRGLTCNRCNQLVSDVERDDDILVKLAEYLYFKSVSSFEEIKGYK